MITASELINLVEADRQARGMSAAGYAAFLGINKGYYSRLRNGKRKPSINILRILKATLPDLHSQVDDYLSTITD